MDWWSLLNKKNVFSPVLKRGTATALIASSLVVGAPVSAQAWSGRVHTAVASAAEMKNPVIASYPDKPQFRGKRGTPSYMEHFVNKPKTDSAAVKKFINTATGKDAYNAVHYLGDVTQPLHAYKYGEFNKAYHSTFDRILNDMTEKELSKSLSGVTPAVGDLKKNVRKELLKSNKLAMRLEKEGRVITRKEAIGRLRRSVALSKQYLAENPGIEATSFLLNKEASATLRAESLATALAKNTKATLASNKTTGLVTNVMHKSKIGHNYGTAAQKGLKTINKAIKRAAKTMLRMR